MSKHARTTITIPADLKARMEAIEESVNWSALACEAFEQKLAELITKKGTRNMTEVINRLRVSKQKLESKQYREGHAAGTEWAKDVAEVQELINLDYNRDQFGSHWDGWWQNTGRPGSWRFLACLVKGDSHHNDSDERDFWQRHGKGNEITGEFAHGFADGALFIWDEVKDQL
jgi:hypothetical protein